MNTLGQESRAASSLVLPPHARYSIYFCGARTKFDRPVLNIRDWIGIAAFACFDFHTGDEIACNKGHHGPVHCVRFSPGGESYASGSEDGTVRIWQTGPLTDDDTEALAVTSNGSVGKVKVNADEVSRKIEDFQIADEGKSTDKKEAGNE